MVKLVHFASSFHYFISLFHFARTIALGTARTASARSASSARGRATARGRAAASVATALSLRRSVVTIVGISRRVEGAVLLELALLGEFGVAPSLGVSYDEVHALDALCGDLVLGVLRLGGHADGEEAEVAETHALAVEDEFLEMVEGVHQHTVDAASGVRRAVVGDVRDEVLEVDLAVVDCGGVPFLLASVLASLRSALNLSVLQSSFSVVCHNCFVFSEE